MPRLPSKLNDQQIEILRWVAEGAPSDRYSDSFAHRITARALQVRGYVTIDGHGASWDCSITASGAAWLEARPVAVDEPASTVADALIGRVLGAGGSLRVDRRTDGLGVVVAESMRSHRRPRGQMLVTRHEGLLSDHVRVELVPHYEEVVPPLIVKVSDTAAILRPLAKTFLQNREWSFVSASRMHRAARALQALEIEVEHRGWVASEPPTDFGGRQVHWRAQHAHMYVETAHTAFLVQMAEVSRAGGTTIPFADRGSVRHGRPPKGRPPWIGSRSTEFVPSGRLEIRLWGHLQNHEGTPFRESMQTSTKLSDVLGQLIRTIAISDLKFEQRQKDEARAHEEQAVQWEQARERAALQFAEARRADVLAHQVRKWEEAEGIRSYIAAARRRLGPADLTACEEWFEWAERHADALDPMLRPGSLLPVVPEPTPEELLPYLGGFDPQGPRPRFS